MRLFDGFHFFQRRKMPTLRRFFIVAACFCGITVNALSQQCDEARRVNANLSSDYRLNRTGAQAYMQGGAFAAETGNVTAMLFNPAGLVGLSGRLTATVEAGWISKNAGQSFFDDELVDGLQPVQFAGIGLQPWRRFAIGVYYAQPARYNDDEVEVELVESTRRERRHHRHHVESRVMKREQISLGMALASVLGKQFYLGGGVEWRSSVLRERFFRMRTPDDAAAVRFSAGAILNVWDWRIGISGQTKYHALDLEKDYTPGRLFFEFDETPASSASFVEAEAATMRLGIATPYVLGRLRFNADAEYKNFAHEAFIAPWQFYGGGTFKLAANVYLVSVRKTIITKDLFLFYFFIILN